MNTAERDTLHALLSALVDGTATDDQMVELSQLLERDERVRRIYLRYLDMHAALTGGPAFASRVPRRRPWSALLGGLLAASLIIGWFGLPAPVQPAATSPAGGPERSAVVGYVATIAMCSEDALLNGGPVVVGMRLAPGPFELSGGTIDIQFDGGARLLFEGNSRFALRSRRAVVIERATFVFRGDQTCEPLEITTPHSVFKDIGTRYAAVVDARAEEVHVADGSVRRTIDGESNVANHELITAGVGRRYESGTATGSAIPLNSALVRRPTPGSVAAQSIPTASDDFSGDARSIGGLSSGSGWRAPWISHKEAGFPELSLASPGLSGDRSVAVAHDATRSPATGRKAAAHRLLTHPIDLSKDGIWYVRFLVRRGPPVAGDNHLGMVVLRTSGLTVQEEIDQKSTIKLAIQGDDGATILFANTSTRSSLPLNPGQTYAVVAKIVAGSTNPDQVFMRIMAADRLAAAPEPIDWSVASESIATEMLLDQVSLEFVSTGRIELGGLCIGLTWESISRPLGPAPK
jgi:ferric-dicitrate binding protein FerR (iron transport regulator)